MHNYNSPVQHRLCLRRLSPKRRSPRHGPAMVSLMHRTQDHRMPQGFVFRELPNSKPCRKCGNLLRAFFVGVRYTLETLEMACIKHSSSFESIERGRPKRARAQAHVHTLQWGVGGAGAEQSLRTCPTDIQLRVISRMFDSSVLIRMSAWMPCILRCEH